jgi:hypothetical protein
MNIKPVQVQLETDEVRQILQIALDEDTQAGLTLIQTVLTKKVEKEHSASIPYRGLLHPPHSHSKLSMFAFTPPPCRTMSHLHFNFPQ